MTVCVGLPIPCKDLNPYDRSFRFLGHGVAIGADSRYLRGNKRSDDGLKVVELTDYAIAGFAGDDLSVVENALGSLTDQLRAGDIRKPKSVIARATKVLTRYWNATGRPKTDVLIAICAKRGRCTLYLLSSSEDFNSQKKDGLVAIGSGATEFMGIFRDEARAMSYSWERRGLGRQFYVRGFDKLPSDQLLQAPPQPGDSHDVPFEHAEQVLSISLDRTLVETQLENVGGSLRVLDLTKDGVRRMELFISSDDGQTFQERSPTTPLKRPSEMR